MMNISPQDSISDHTIPDDYDLDDILTSNQGDSPLPSLSDITAEVQADEYWPCVDNMDTTINGIDSIRREPVLSPSSVCGYDSSFQGCNPVLLYREETCGDNESSRKASGRGLAGLINFGNTCFMNSALQCLFHTPPFVEYFLGDYRGEINIDNPLGTHGELALSFGELLRKVWSSEEKIMPLSFKENLAKFAPQFGGYNQHDSQELLAFLLDGLHEDLNRVKNKPYIEKTDAEGPDEELALEFWKNHKARNDSIIVDIFQGQYKSKLVCPECGRISITFDPFMYLSLPVPSMTSREMTITVIHGDGSSQPHLHTLTVMDHWFIKDLLHHLAVSCNLKTEEDDLVLVEVSYHRIIRYFSDPMEHVNSIRDADFIVAYVVPLVREGLIKIELLHRRMERCGPRGMECWETKFFATPIMVFVAYSSVNKGVHLLTLVDKMLSPFKRSPMEKEEGYEFHLCVTTNEMEFCCKPVDKWSELKYGTSTSSTTSSIIINSSNCMTVMMDWMEKENREYDSGMLMEVGRACKRWAGRRGQVSVMTCLEAFVKEEPLGEDDMWYCCKCKRHRQAMKKLDLWRLPEILVIHLKRFSYSGYVKTKVDKRVEFPVSTTLDLTKYVISEGRQVYHLFAVSNHFGSMGSGHYTAYAKMDGEEKGWYNFNDEMVLKMREDEVISPAAYVLFYKRAGVISS